MGAYGSPDLSQPNNPNMVVCKTCGKEIAKSAKVCPSCGAKVKEPIYKKWWLWLIIVLVIAAAPYWNEKTPSTSTSNLNPTTTNVTSSSTNSNTTVDRKVKQATDLYNKALTEYQNEDYEKALQRCEEYLNKYSDIDAGVDINALKIDIETAIPHITATKLVNAYKDNEVKADSLYKNKLLIITGVIDSIGKDILDQTYITLNDGSKYSFDYAQCYFSDAQEIAKVAELSKGKKVTVIGKCTGATILNPSVKDCKIY